VRSGSHTVLGGLAVAGAALVLLLPAGAAASGTGAVFTPQPAPLFVGIDAGGGPYATVYDAPSCFGSVYTNGCWQGGWLADYDMTQGGVQIAVGDVTGDGKADVVTAPGKGGRADVRAFTGAGSQEASFYTNGFNGGYRVALGDVNGDGRLDYVLGNEDWSGPFVQVVDGKTGNPLGSFDTGSGGGHGVHVAAGDFNGDGRAEIVTANAAGLEPRISIWPGVPGPSPTPLRSFLAFGPTETAGVEIAVGDLTGDGRADIAALTDGPQGPELRVFDGTTLALLSDSFPFTSAAPDSLRVAIGDVDGDGKPDLVVAGDTPDGPQIEALTASGTRLLSLPGVSRGESIAVGDVTGDGKADIVVSDGPSQDARVTVFAADGSLDASFSPYGPSFTNGVRVAAGDFDGDGGTEYLTGQGPGGTSEVDLFDQTGALLLALHPFAGAGSDGVYVAAGDVEGDGRAQIVVGAAAGGEPRVSVYSRTGTLLSSFLAFEPTFTGGVRVAVGDLEGDGKAEVIVGSGPGRPAEVRIFTASGTLLRTIVPFSPSFAGGVFPAAGDLTGDGRAEIAVATGAGGDGIVRTFDGAGTALARFQPYGATPSDVHVAVGDVLDGGAGRIVTASGRVAPATVDIFRPDGSRIDFILANSGFEGGLWVAVPQPIGPALQAAVPTVQAIEGRRVRLAFGLTDPAGRDGSDDVVASTGWGDGTKASATVAGTAGSPLPISTSHAFATCGSFRVRITVVDRYRRSRLLTTTARIGDAPLIVHGLLLGRYAGTVATVRDGDPRARPGDLSAVVRWDGRAAVHATIRRTGRGRFAVRAPLPSTRGRRHVAIVRVHDRCGAHATARTLLRAG
jgi:FG-GAP-like repeat